MLNNCYDQGITIEIYKEELALNEFSDQESEVLLGIYYKSWNVVMSTNNQDFGENYNIFMEEYCKLAFKSRKWFCSKIKKINIQEKKTLYFLFMKYLRENIRKLKKTNSFLNINLATYFLY